MTHINKCLDKICTEYKKFPQTRAIAIGGSSANKTNDKISDIDLYVFVDKDIPIQDRLELTKNIQVNMRSVVNILVQVMNLLLMRWSSN